MVRGIEFFQTSGDGLTTKKELLPISGSHGHPPYFYYAARESPFFAEIGIARMKKMIKYSRMKFVPIPVA